MENDSLDPMIRDAYAIAAQPERLMKLLTVLQSPVVEDEGSLQPHFANVTELLTEIDPSVGDDFSTYGQDLDGAGGQLMLPDLKLSTSMTVLSVDEQIFKSSELNRGQSIPDWLFGVDRESYAQVEKLMKGRGKASPAIVRLYTDREDDRGVLFAAQLTAAGSAELDFRIMRLRWNETIGKVFAKSLELRSSWQNISSMACPS